MTYTTFCQLFAEEIHLVTGDPTTVLHYKIFAEKWGEECLFYEKFCKTGLAKLKVVRFLAVSPTAAIAFHSRKEDMITSHTVTHLCQSLWVLAVM